MAVPPRHHDHRCRIGIDSVYLAAVESPGGYASVVSTLPILCRCGSLLPRTALCRNLILQLFNTAASLTLIEILV